MAKKYKLSPFEIVKARRSLGLTQKEMGLMLTRHAMTISRWERGTGKPDGLACRVLDWVLRGFDPEKFESNTPRQR